VYDFDEDSEDSSDGEWSSDVESSDGDTAGSDGGEYMPTPERIFRGAMGQLPLLEIGASGAAKLLRGTWVTCCSKLASSARNFDLDGYVCVYRGQVRRTTYLSRPSHLAPCVASLSSHPMLRCWCLQTLKELIALVDGRHPIHPLGADRARARGLYDPAEWAFTGLARPEKRHGMGVAIARNCNLQFGWNRNNLGYRVEDPANAGEQVVLTKAMLDSGINAVHRMLKETSCEQDKIKGLRRLDDGEHGAWEALSIDPPLYKLLQATHACELAALTFDFAQKARCAK
jgi:hypothetical protein